MKHGKFFYFNGTIVPITKMGKANRKIIKVFKIGHKEIYTQTFSQILILSKSLLQTPFSLDWPENVLEEMNIDSDEEQLEII